MPSSGWGGKTKNQDKNKSKFSACLPCNQPNEEMDGDGQAGVEKPPVGAALVCTGTWMGRRGQVSKKGWWLLASGFAAAFTFIYALIAI